MLYIYPKKIKKYINIFCLFLITTFPFFVRFCLENIGGAGLEQTAAPEPDSGLCFGGKKLNSI